MERGRDGPAAICPRIPHSVLVSCIRGLDATGWRPLTSG